MNPWTTPQWHETEERTGRTVWRPWWAFALAVVAALLLLLPFTVGVGVLVSIALNPAPGIARDVALSIGSLAVVVSGAGLLPLGWFFRRGGVIPWALGMTVAAAAVAVFVSTL
ncbi:hypothetical protein [Kribbia dieselivorans]|uniref:hypothetical protein n=1 Tax=Kribbia dieselivorans TaxID=331526 RepID=UPI0008384862|nr:hypothetical protein [Kribbia dieselivorans]